MAAQSQILSMGQQFSGLPMGALIGGPLDAAAKANQQMAMTQLQFMMTTCFNEKSPNTGNYEPIMIEMTLEKSVIQPVEPTTAQPNPAPIMSVSKTAFRLPLITIIPLNSLAVDDVKIDFEMEVKSSFSQDNSSKSSTDTAAQGSFSAGASYGPFHVEVHGSVSSKSHSESSSASHYKQSNSARYEVSVHAGQLPLPEGVKTIIDAYAKNVNPIILPAEGSNSGSGSNSNSGSGSGNG